MPRLVEKLGRQLGSDQAAHLRMRHCGSGGITNDMLGKVASKLVLMLRVGRSSLFRLLDLIHWVLGLIVT